MTTKPRVLVPYGLKTLLEGLSRAVVNVQPTNITHYASFYFAELLQYRQENPSMDFKDLVQEFQCRQENAQTQRDHAENAKPVPKVSIESETVEAESEPCPAKQDPYAGNASTAEAMPPLPTVGGKDSVQCQPQEHTSSGVDVSVEQSAEEPERLHNVSCQEQSQPTETLEKQGSVDETVPKMSNDQTVYLATRGQDPPPRSVPSTGRATDGATPSFSPNIPLRTISKTQDSSNNHADVERIVSNIFQHSPEHSPIPGSAIYIAQQTVEWQLPTKGVAQLEIKSEPTESQQETTEIPSPNTSQIPIPVDKSESKVCYLPAYIPGKDASLIYIGSKKAGNPCENIQSPTVNARHPPKDPVKYKSVRGPSQAGSRLQCVCRMPSFLHLQPPTYKTTKSSNHSVPSDPEKLNSSESVNKQGYSEASNQLSADSIQQNLMASPGENEEANPQNSYKHSDSRQINQPADLLCRIGQLPSQRPNKEILACPCMSDLPSSIVSKAPAYGVPADVKRVQNSSISVGSNGQKTGKAVHSRNGQDYQSFARTEPNTRNHTQGSGFQRDPMFASAPAEDMETLSAALSITHLAEVKSIACFDTKRNVAAVRVAVNACPASMNNGFYQSARAKASQDGAGYIIPPKAKDKRLY